MKWLDGLPTVPGFYWRCMLAGQSLEYEPCEMYLGAGGPHIRFLGTDNDLWLEGVDTSLPFGRYFGPVEPPKYGENP